MLDEKDIQIISGMLEQQERRFDEKLERLEGRMDEKLAQMEGRFDEKMEQQNGHIMHNVSILMESKFQPQFNLLAEGIRAIQKKLDELAPKERVWELEEDIKLLKTVVRQHSEEIEQLKKAE